VQACYSKLWIIDQQLSLVSFEYVLIHTIFRFSNYKLIMISCVVENDDILIRLSVLDVIIKEPRQMIKKSTFQTNIVKVVASSITSNPATCMC
jgi:hypothetical protein